jgi:hypothetical protein
VLRRRRRVSKPCRVDARVESRGEGGHPQVARLRHAAEAGRRISPSSSRCRRLRGGLLESFRRSCKSLSDTTRKAPIVPSMRLSAPSISYTRSRWRTGRRSRPRGRSRSFVNTSRGSCSSWRSRSSLRHCPWRQSSLPLSHNQTSDNSRKLCRVDGLRDMHLEAGGQSVIPIVGACESGNGDGR